MASEYIFLIDGLTPSEFWARKKTEACFLKALASVLCPLGLEASGFPKQGWPVLPVALDILRLQRPDFHLVLPHLVYWAREALFMYIVHFCDLVRD